MVAKLVEKIRIVYELICFAWHENNTDRIEIQTRYLKVLCSIYLVDPQLSSTYYLHCKVYMCNTPGVN